MNSLWNFGFLTGIFFVSQIFSGILIASRYTSTDTLAFNSIIYIVRETNAGWIYRYLHSTGASILFICLFLHISRSLIITRAYKYLSSTWTSGIIILLLMIVIAFLGYVLPYGQMSYWGATVITNLLKFIPKMVTWVCGDFSISTATLNRFLVLHFILPFCILYLSVMHIFYLHLSGSSSTIIGNKLEFFPLYVFSDLKVLMVLTTLYTIQVFYPVFAVSDNENSLLANKSITPRHIIP